MPDGALPAPTANDRLKGSFDSWVLGSVALTAALHYAAFAYWPAAETATQSSLAAVVLEQVEVVQELKLPVELPPAPALAREIVKAAAPVISANLDIAPEITIEEVSFREAAPVVALPRVAAVRVAAEPAPAAGEPAFTPHEVAPELANRATFARLLEREYPRLLREAGVGGTTVLWVLIDEQGVVQNTKVVRSSGHVELDRVAERVMRKARFSPALNHDQRVPVWIQLPVAFSVD